MIERPAKKESKHLLIIEGMKKGGLMAGSFWDDHL